MLQDIDMYYDETDTPAMARTSNLNEELGQVCQLTRWSIIKFKFEGDELEGWPEKTANILQHHLWFPANLCLRIEHRNSMLRSG